MNKNSSLTLPVLIYAAFISTFNETVLNVALLAISESFGVSLAASQWLITGYMLVAAVMVPVTAFLYLSVPTKRLFIITLSFLCVGSIGCVLSVPLDSFIVILFFRLFQAVGTGMMFPILMNTTMIIIPRERLGSAIALCVCSTSVGPAVAPTIAGLIIQNAHWSMIFVLIAILSAIAILLGIIAVKNVAVLTYPKLDVLSVVLSTLGLGSLLYGLSNVASKVALGSAFLAVGAVIIGLFAYRQKKLKEPVLNLSPFSNKFFSVGLLLVTISMMICFAIGAYMPTYLQGTGIASAVSAAVLMPGLLLNLVTTNIIGKVVDKIGTKVVLPLGFLIMTAGLLLLSVFVSTKSMILIVFIYIIISQGVAFSLPSGQTASMSTLPVELNPHGIGILNTFIVVGGSLGSAVYSGIENSVIHKMTAAGLDSVSALTAGFKAAVIVSAVLTAAAVIIAVIMHIRKNAD